MADIRINALATTAASTASDDFVAVDGSANGTRKLNAYSPTFGGNLTVSGTGTSSVAGVFKAGTDIVTGDTSAFQVHNNVDDKPMVGFYRGGTLRSVLRLNTDNDFRLLSSDLSTPANLTAGNLTVSGTGNSSIAGTLLVATTTNSSNGKFQLADHTTSAGGIGFGTDTALYRAAAQSLNLDGASSPQFSLSVSGTQKARLESYSDDLYISTLTAGKSIILRSGNGTTALTLDSSQRCILAGALRLNNAYTAGAPTATGYVTIQDSAGNTYKVLVGT